MRPVGIRIRRALPILWAHAIWLAIPGDIPTAVAIAPSEQHAETDRA